MAKVNVAKGLFWDNISGEEKLGYRHPVTHGIVFDDADQVEVPDVPVAPEPAEPETVEVDVDDPRLEALPEADEE